MENKFPYPWGVSLRGGTNALYQDVYTNEERLKKMTEDIWKLYRYSAMQTDLINDIIDWINNFEDTTASLTAKVGKLDARMSQVERLIEREVKLDNKVVKNEDKTFTFYDKYGNEGETWFGEEIDTSKFQTPKITKDDGTFLTYVRNNEELNSVPAGSTFSIDPNYTAVRNYGNFGWCVDYTSTLRYFILLDMSGGRMYVQSGNIITDNGWIEIGGGDLSSYQVPKITSELGDFNFIVKNITELNSVPHASTFVVTSSFTELSSLGSYGWVIGSGTGVKVYLLWNTEGKMYIQKGLPDASIEGFKEIGGGSSGGNSYPLFEALNSNNEVFNGDLTLFNTTDINNYYTPTNINYRYNSSANTLEILDKGSYNIDVDVGIKSNIATTGYIIITLNGKVIRSDEVVIPYNKTTNLKVSGDLNAYLDFNSIHVKLYTADTIEGYVEYQHMRVSKIADSPNESIDPEEPLKPVIPEFPDIDWDNVLNLVPITTYAEWIAVTEDSTSNGGYFANDIIYEDGEYDNHEHICNGVKVFDGNGYKFLSTSADEGSLSITNAQVNFIKKGSKGYYINMTQYAGVVGKPTGVDVGSITGKFWEVQLYNEQVLINYTLEAFQYHVILNDGVVKNLSFDINSNNINPQEIHLFNADNGVIKKSDLSPVWLDPDDKYHNNIIVYNEGLFHDIQISIVNSPLLTSGFKNTPVLLNTDNVSDVNTYSLCKYNTGIIENVEIIPTDTTYGMDRLHDYGLYIIYGLCDLNSGHISSCSGLGFVTYENNGTTENNTYGGEFYNDILFIGTGTSSDTYVPKPAYKD